MTSARTGIMHLRLVAMSREELATWPYHMEEIWLTDILGEGRGNCHGTPRVNSSKVLQQEARLKTSP